MENVWHTASIAGSDGLTSECMCASLSTALSHIFVNVPPSYLHTHSLSLNPTSIDIHHRSIEHCKDLIQLGHSTLHQPANWTPSVFPRSPISPNRPTPFSGHLENVDNTFPSARRLLTKTQRSMRYRTTTLLPSPT